VWKKIRRIQREFLWGCRQGRKKTCWIKWEVVCLPKKKGGLGVRDVRAVNISLLAKWRWRLLEANNTVWQEVIKAKYGTNAVGRVDVGLECQPWYASLWWKDICSIGANLDIHWFSRSVYKKLGNGASISFWFDSWVGDAPLKYQFPRLFAISSQKEEKVASVWNPVGGVERWNLRWRRRFFVWEEELVEEFKNLISNILVTNVEDRWCWRPENDVVFTVKSAYCLISNLPGSVGFHPPWSGRIFDAIWKCKAPSKVSGFVWQLLHNRIPTKDNLILRNIIHTGESTLCPLCGKEIEKLLTCLFTVRLQHRCGLRCVIG
jgi:hypothetical protein